MSDFWHNDFDQLTIYFLKTLLNSWNSFLLGWSNNIFLLIALQEMFQKESDLEKKLNKLSLKETEALTS